MENILEFWFPNNNFNKFWFDGSKDEFIIEKYKQYLEKKEEIDIPNLSNEKLLSYIILYDQFSRNIYRKEKEKIKYFDKLSIKLSNYFFENKEWINVPVNHLVFYLMPYRHTFDKEKYNTIFEILEIYYDKNKEIIESNNNTKKLFEKFKNQTYKKLPYKYRVSDSLV